MKVLIITNDIRKSGTKKPFTVVREDIFAQRFIDHVNNDYADMCNACEPECDHCRDKYPKLYRTDFKEDVAGIIRLPAEMPYYVDDPEDFLPDKLPEHDVLVAINIHEDILMALPKRSKAAGGQAIVVPSEDPEWVSAWVRGRVKKICQELEMEAAFPKPFCSMSAEADQPVIDRFIRHFRIGRPKIQVRVQDGKIIEAQVIISAPCGCTYYVAHNLVGKEVTEDLNTEVTAKYWHSYPCVASMDMDRELGDTPLHKGGYMHYQCVTDAVVEQCPDIVIKTDRVQITGK